MKAFNLLAFTKSYVHLNLLGFFLKASSAFLLAWMAANNFDTNEFRIWAVFFSISMVMSSGDLGVGQYILTYMSDARRDLRVASEYFFDGMSSLLAICVPIFFLGMAAISLADIDLLTGTMLCILVVLRVPMIAYSALLQVHGRVHEKRLIEALPYLIALPIFYTMHLNNYGVYPQLLVISALLTFGSFIFLLRSKFLGAPQFRWSSINRVKFVFKKAFPYFLNNLSGLAIYGGFIFIFSFHLSSYELAVLSIYHTVILTLGYQTYDVVFRSYQLRISEVKVFRGLAFFLTLSMGLAIFVISTIGIQVLQFFYSTYRFEKTDMILFAVFACLEFGYLLASHQIQMNVLRSKILTHCSLIKMVSFLLATALLSSVNQVNLSLVCEGLIMFSGLNLVVFIFLRNRTQL